MKKIENFSHNPVLLKECVLGLNIKPGGVYVDATVGGAGHSTEIAKRLGDGGRLFAFDRDPDAVLVSKARLSKYPAEVINSNFCEMQNCLKERGVQQVDGVLIDLGVSSYQLDNPERGFSYRSDAPLDMRMDRSAGLSAKDIVNSYSDRELTRILRDYGEERMAARIAANIVRAREEAPLETTGQLVQIIERSIPMKMRERGGNPCKRTFQAIRIACNRELEVLEDTLDCMIDLLAPQGRLCIITFHSLEDRIVKNAFRRNENPCTCPPEFPVCTCGQVSKGKVITRKPILPGKEELQENRRSASAKLRIFEKRPEN